jgi:phosphate transport system substrate-binding protein
MNPRSPSTNLQAVFGGYLSLEVLGSDGQPLWSWLVTPGRLSWNSIVDDLTGHAAKKLLDAAKSNGASSPAPGAGGALAETTLVGAGATFPAPLYQKWFQDFEQLHPGVTIRYSQQGSQLGVERILAGQLDFAGSDIAPEEIIDPQAASHLHRIASVLGAVVPIYNIKGVSRDLRFTPEALADIYLGRVRRWNDPEIGRINRGVDLPDVPIAVVHRSDGSGTTWVWSDFLSKVSPAWAATIGRNALLKWPVGSGAERNEGVAETVQTTPNSIGYVELAYAIQHQLSFGTVRNRAGEFIHADLDSLAAAASGFAAAGEPPATITDSPARNAYPIAAFTWLLFPVRSSDPANRAALGTLLRWLLTSGQKECSALGYAPLPQDIADAEFRLLNTWP